MCRISLRTFRIEFSCGIVVENFFQDHIQHLLKETFGLNEIFYFTNFKCLLGQLVSDAVNLLKQLENKNSKKSFLEHIQNPVKYLRWNFRGQQFFSKRLNGNFKQIKTQIYSNTSLCRKLLFCLRFFLFIHDFI